MTRIQQLRLCDIGRVITGKTPSTKKPDNFGGPIPFVTPGDLESSGTIARTLSREGVRESRLAPAGSALVCCIGTIGKIGVFDQDVAFNQQLNAVVPNRQLINPSYLVHALRALRPQMQHFASSTTVPILSKSRFEELVISVPSLQEQTRIAAILNQVENVLANRLKTLEQIDVLAESVFLGLFGQPLSDETPWPRKELGSVAKIIRGASPRPAGDPRYFGGPIPWLKISDLTASPGRVVTAIKEGVTEAGRERSVFLPPGTLVLSNSATVGLPKVVEPATCIHDGFLAFLDINEGLERDWLYAALAASRDRLVSLAPEGTQKNLNTGIVKGVRIGIPPQQLQVEYLKRVSAIEVLQSRGIAALAATRRLEASLRFRTLAGEL